MVLRKIVRVVRVYILIEKKAPQEQHPHPTDTHIKAQRTTKYYYDVQMHNYVFAVKVHLLVQDSPFFTTLTLCTRRWAKGCPAAHSITEYGRRSEWATGNWSLDFQV